MLLFRSEEEVETWCTSRRIARGGVVPVRQLQELAIGWYGDRLRAGWRPRGVEGSQELLERVGLTGPFWRLT